MTEQKSIFTTGMTVAIWHSGSWSMRVRKATVTKVQKSGRFQTDNDKWWRASNYDGTRAKASPRKDYDRDHVEPWTDATDQWLAEERLKSEHRSRVNAIQGALSKIKEFSCPTDVLLLGQCLVAMAFEPAAKQQQG